MNSWQIVQNLGLVVSRPEPDQTLVYGSSDPYPNPAELILTQFIAKRYGLGWRFFIYRHGKNLPMPEDPGWVNTPGVFNIEAIIPEGLTLGKIAEEIWRLRGEPSIIAHLPGGNNLRATSNPYRKWSGDWSSATIPQLHESGGWLGGSSIHFLLRLWAEDRPWVIFACRFQEKGRVYTIYRGIKRPLFVCVPFLRFIPPKKLGLPSWAPATWSYWMSLPPSYRKRVRKEVKKRILRGKLRIEIQLL